MEGWKDEGMIAWIRGWEKGLIQRWAELGGLGQSFFCTMHAHKTYIK